MVEERVEHAGSADRQRVGREIAGRGDAERQDEVAVVEAPVARVVDRQHRRPWGWSRRRDGRGRRQRADQRHAVEEVDAQRRLRRSATSTKSMPLNVVELDELRCGGPSRSCQRHLDLVVCFDCVSISTYSIWTRICESSPPGRGDGDVLHLDLVGQPAVQACWTRSCVVACSASELGANSSCRSPQPNSAGRRARRAWSAAPGGSSGRRAWRRPTAPPGPTPGRSGTERHSRARHRQVLPAPVCLDVR